jgi:hypothetical protein
LNWIQFQGGSGGTRWLNLDHVAQASISPGLDSELLIDLADGKQVKIRPSNGGAIDKLRARLILMAERSAIACGPGCDCPKCRDESAEIGDGKGGGH